MSNRIRELRQAKGFSAYQLAAICGVSQPAISYIERGAHKPRPSTAKKIAEALGKPVNDVFKPNGFDRRAAGSKGGKTAASRMTPEARKARALKGNTARWQGELKSRLSGLTEGRSTAELRRIVAVIEAAFPR